MAVFKSFALSDISKNTFNTNKHFKFISSSAVQRGISLQKFTYTSQSIDTFQSNDPNNHIKYNQLDHLYYRNNKLDINNKFGDIYFSKDFRELHDKVNVISVPSLLYGDKIKEGTFYFSGSGFEIVDDKKGNLIISSSDVGDYIPDINNRVFYLGPINGYRKYDLNSSKHGLKTPNPVSYFNFENTYDDSHYYNTIDYKEMTFVTMSNSYNWTGGGPQNGDYNINLDGDVAGVFFEGTTDITSSIVAPHNGNYNFNPGNDFTISFWMNPNTIGGLVNGPYTSSIMGKSTTKLVIKTPVVEMSSNVTGSSQLHKVREKNQYPFEIFLTSFWPEAVIEGTPGFANGFFKIHFKKSDGINTPEVIALYNPNQNNDDGIGMSTGSLYHVVCRCSASNMAIFINGKLGGTEIQYLGTNIISYSSGSDTTVKQTENQADLFIGSKGEIENYYNGTLSNISIYNKALTNTQIATLSSSINGSPYIGNMFYNQGLATITHPKYQNIAKPSTTGEDPFEIYFKSNNKIYENEFMCTVESSEYNYTHNISTRKIKTDQKPELADFATGSLWKPYITTVGLYNENNELLVVGKLGQPVRVSDETDTTFVIRYDT